AGAVDEEPEHEHRLRPGRQSPSALPGADGVAVGGETAGEPVAGGTVDRQEGGVCDTQGQETSWENSGFVAEPVSPKRFLCSPRGSAHAPHISACPKKLSLGSDVDGEPCILPELFRKAVVAVVSVVHVSNLVDHDRFHLQISELRLH